QAVSPPVAADARLAAGRGEPEPAAFAEPETAPPPGEAEAEAPEEPPARAPPQAAAAQAPALLPRAPAPTAPLALASDGGVGSEALRGQHDGSHPHEARRTGGEVRSLSYCTLSPATVLAQVLAKGQRCTAGCAMHWKRSPTLRLLPTDPV
ncbi:unnamed protein product, partial [Prorocentrum cordatum]